MSVKLMSAVFESESTDLKIRTGNVTKARAARLVLQASCRRARDERGGGQ